MTERELENLIEMVVEADRLDEPHLGAGDARDSAACLRFAMWDDIAAGRATLSNAERRHVLACRTCTARGRAFGLTVRAAPRRRLVLHAAGAALALAACLLIVVQIAGRSIFRQDQPGNVPRIIANAGGRAANVTVDYAAGDVGIDDRRVDCFQPNVPEHSVILAVMRRWDEACECMVWKLHHWENGETATAAGPEAAPSIAMDVTDDAPVEQLLLVAVSRDPADLPDSAAEADALLECLNSSCPPLSPPDDALACASAVQSCLPAGVSVVPQTFVAGR